MNNINWENVSRSFAVLNGLVIISYFNQLREEVMKCAQQVSASHMNSVWPCLGV